MRVIEHGHDVVEFVGFIKSPQNIIENILALDEDETIHPIMSPFEEWKEGSHNEEGEFEYNVVKGKKKLINLEPINVKGHEKAAKTVRDLVVDPICDPFDECIEIYSSIVGVDPEPASRNLDIRLYNAGEGLRPHGDINHTVQNKYSFVIYLNDDYTGGELDFLDRNITIKPEAGAILAFPSLHEHEALPTISGTKWHIPYFWYLGFGKVMCNKEFL